MEDLVVSCLESRVEENRNLYARFMVGPFFKGDALTVATALRRVLLSSVEGIAITALYIQGITHEFSSIVGVRESVLELSLNFQSIVLCYDKRFFQSGGFGSKSPCGQKKDYFDNSQIGYLQVQGPKVVYANDLKLPLGVKVVDPTQYIATISREGVVVLKFTLGKINNEQHSSFHTSLPTTKPAITQQLLKRNIVKAKTKCKYKNNYAVNRCSALRFGCLATPQVFGGSTNRRFVDQPERHKQTSTKHLWGKTSKQYYTNRSPKRLTPLCPVEQLTNLLWRSHHRTLPVFSFVKQTSRVFLGAPKRSSIQAPWLCHQTASGVGLQHDVKRRFAWSTKTVFTGKYKGLPHVRVGRRPTKHGLQTNGALLPSTIAKLRFGCNKHHRCTQPLKQKAGAVLGAKPPALNAPTVFGGKSITFALPGNFEKPHARRARAKRSLTRFGKAVQALGSGAPMVQPAFTIGDAPTVQRPFGQAPEQPEQLKQSLSGKDQLCNKSNLCFNKSVNHFRLIENRFQSDICLHNIIPLDSSLSPVLKVNFLVEIDDDVLFLRQKVRERIILEVWTNGSIHPRQALHDATLSLLDIFSTFRKIYLNTCP